MGIRRSVCQKNEFLFFPVIISQQTDPGIGKGHHINFIGNISDKPAFFIRVFFQQHTGQIGADIAIGHLLGNHGQCPHRFINRIDGSFQITVDGQLQLLVHLPSHKPCDEAAENNKKQQRPYQIKNHHPFYQRYIMHPAYCHSASALSSVGPHAPLSTYPSGREAPLPQVVSIS